MNRRIRNKRIFGIGGSVAALVLVLGAILWFVLRPEASSVSKEHSPAGAATSSTAPGVQLDVTTRTQVAEQFAQALANDYAYPALGDQMAAAIRARLQAHAYDAITSPQAFANALTSDARATVNDPHLQVQFQFPSASSPRHPSAPSGTAAIPDVEILDGNIGYLVVNAMQPLQVEQPVIAAAFAFLQQSSALILDLRGNTGGTGNDASLIEGYLSNGGSYPTDFIHWRTGNRVQVAKTMNVGKLSYGAAKPVFILTSPTTFSAAEGLAYDLQALKRAVIVGQPTGGGANPSQGGPVPLSHGFVANIPTGYVVNAITGTNWEGAGVQPNVVVPADQALTKAWSRAAASLKTTARASAPQTWLAAFSLAKLSGAPGLDPADLVGRYVPRGGGVSLMILEKDGTLIAQLESARGTEDVALVSVGGDRYQPDGFPTSFALTFVRQGGQIELLQVQQPGGGSWTISEKQ